MEAFGGLCYPILRAMLHKGGLCYPILKYLIWTCKIRARNKTTNAQQKNQVSKINHTSTLDTNKEK